MTVNDWLSLASTQLKQISIPTPRLDAEVILAHCLGVERSWLIAHADESIDPSAPNELLQRRLRREPVAYLVGHKEFYGRDFVVTSDTLIPRPESETLIELLLTHLAPGQSRSKIEILDVGTGTGCLGITLANELPHAHITLSDISEKALEIARRNAANLTTGPIEFVMSDLLTHWKESAAAFDVIVANLPYVNTVWDRSPETEYEPSSALFADDEGHALIYQLITQTPAALSKEGLLLLEADPEQHDAIIDRAKKHGFREIESREYAVLLKRD